MRDYNVIGLPASVCGKFRRVAPMSLIPALSRSEEHCGEFIALNSHQPLNSRCSAADTRKYESEHSAAMKVQWLNGLALMSHSVD